MGFLLRITTTGKPEASIHLLRGGEYIVGRSSECDVVIEDPHMSRRALTLTMSDAGGWRIQNLAAQRQIYVNRRACAEGSLHPGDIIEVGTTRMVLLSDEAMPVAGDQSVTVVVEEDQVFPGTCAHSLRADEPLTDHAIATAMPERNEAAVRLHGFFRLSETLAVAEDPDLFFGAVLDVLFETVAPDRGFVALGDSRRGTFQPVRVRDVRGEGDGAITMSQTVLDEIQSRREALLIENASTELPRGGQNSITKIGIRSILCAPMFAGGEYLGVLYLDRLSEDRPFAREDLVYVQGIARLSALALDSMQYRERLRAEHSKLRQGIQRRSAMVAGSPRMLEVLRKIPKLAEHEAPLLITGETGTGKELIARAVHDESARARGPFIAFNCALSNPALIDSELFGHVKGAFTDAARDHKGKFQLADGGTLFLDEIGELPLETQAKLLRVLEERRVEPVGGEKAVPVDFRLVSATHRDLNAMQQKGTFRADLFYRLAVLSVALPPLRERGGDIAEIARALLPSGVTIDDAALASLAAYAWPGNVRELVNVIEQACFNAEGAQIKARDLPAHVAKEGRKQLIDVPYPRLADLEAHHVQRVLGACGGNKKRAAEVLGISRETLYQKIKLYQIEIPVARDDA